mgnify:CR=1 FL=1
MKELLLIIFLVSLFYMSIANRMRNYVKILIMQGALLFLVAVIQLHEVNAFNVAMISLETIVFKGERGVEIAPSAEDVDGFNVWIENYKSCIPVEQKAAECKK